MGKWISNCKQVLMRELERGKKKTLVMMMKMGLPYEMGNEAGESEREGEVVDITNNYDCIIIV